MSQISKVRISVYFVLIAENVIDMVTTAVVSLPPALRCDNEEIREAARRAARRGFREQRGKRPPTTVHLVRL